MLCESPGVASRPVFLATRALSQLKADAGRKRAVLLIDDEEEYLRCAFSFRLIFVKEQHSLERDYAHVAIFTISTRMP